MTDPLMGAMAFLVPCAGTGVMAGFFVRSLMEGSWGMAVLTGLATLGMVVVTGNLWALVRPELEPAA